MMHGAAGNRGTDDMPNNLPGRPSLPSVLLIAYSPSMGPEHDQPLFGDMHT